MDVVIQRSLRSGESKEKIRKTIEIGLERMGIKWDDVKDQLEILVNRK